MFIEIFKTVLAALRSAFRSRAALFAENATSFPAVFRQRGTSILP
jgi:hypothetical protein